MSKIKIIIICLIGLALLWLVYNYFDKPTFKEVYVKVSFDDIKDIERGKKTYWSNIDSTVTLKYMFKDLNFLANYIMYALIEVRHDDETSYYLREVSPHTEDIVQGDTLYVFPKYNTSITGWHHVHKKGSYRMDYDSVQWQKSLLERKDIAIQNNLVDSLPYGTYKLQDGVLIKVRGKENPFLNRNRGIYGIFNVTPPGMGHVDIFNLDSLSKELLSSDPPKTLESSRITD